jgi:glycosyltransferase involved in cell wall biosynthesis
MIEPAQTHLVLFLSRATPLNRWAQMGILERELAIYKALERSLAKISIVSSGRKDECLYLNADTNIKILYNTWNLSANLYSLLAPMLHWQSLRQASVYMTNQMDGAWTALIAGLLYHKPVIARAGYLWAELNRQSGGRGIKAFLIDLLQALAFRQANKVFLTSQDMARNVSHKYQIPNKRISVIPNYVDTELFRPMPEETALPQRICYTGRLDAVKNLSSLILALKGIPEPELVLLGEGDQRQALEQLAAQNQVEVIFKGAIPNNQVPIEINRAQVFVLPSLSEGHPKALIEAMACGAAVLGTDVPGIRGLIQHEINGLLCQTDPASLREGIRRLLNDSGLRKTLGASARRYTTDNFALTKVAELELEQIMEVVNTA